MKLKITQIKDVTERVRLFSFIHADGDDLMPYTPGAHLDFDLGETGTRSYSLLDFVPAVPVPGAYHIAVQAEPDGDGGSLAMHALDMGDEVTASAPKNSFELHEGDAPAVLIAGGIGVTPIISFATALAQRGAAYHFHYAARDRAVCAFARELQNTFGKAMTLWLDDTNQIDVAAALQDAPQNAYLYCCGPKGMIQAVKSAAEAAGYPSNRIRFELFETPGPQDGDQPFEIEINDGQTFTIPPGQSIIDVLKGPALT